MSMHPNVILMVALEPNDLARKTMKNILQASKADEDGNIKIDGVEYNSIVMESDYDESSQISGNEGDLIFYDLITYGYGEKTQWEVLNSRKEQLEKWAIRTSNKFECDYKIYITANYW